MTSDIVNINVDEIKVFLDRQSRKDSFSALVNHIRDNGVLVPIQVTEITKPKKQKKKKKGKGKWKYQLVWGHRRLRGAKEAGLKTIPAKIVSIDDKERVKRFFIENEARKQLTAYEMAQLIEADRDVLSISEIADKYSMREYSVKRILRVLESASPVLRKYLDDGRISFDEAKTISTVQDPKEQTVILNRVVERGLKGNYLKNEVKVMRGIAGSSGRVSNKSIEAKRKALVETLRESIEEKDSVSETYLISAGALVDAIKDKNFRDTLDKYDIDYSAFGG